MIWTWRWRLMMRGFAAHIGYVATYLAVAICYATNVVVPRSGDLLRAVLLGWSDQGPLESMLGSIAAERVFDVLLLVLLAGAVFTIVAPQHMAYYPDLMWSIPLAIAAGVLLLGLMVVFAAGRYTLVVRCMRWVSPRLSALVEPHIAALALGMGALRSPRLFALIAAVSLVMHLGYASLLYVGFWGLGLVEGYGLGGAAALTTMVVSGGALLTASGCPIAAPSANLSGEVSPTRAGHVAHSLGGKVDLILDGGPCRLGVESTVLDLTRDIPTILRPGGVPREALEDAIGPIEVLAETSAAPASPGMLASHYAPGLKLRAGIAEILDGEALLSFGPHDLTGFSEERNLSPRGDLAEAAANLFAMMRALDRPEFTGIAAMRVPDEGLGRAINDRLERAAAPR